ncbi:MAG: hypothetical protein WKF84_14505 [Pyrinomonadaceae bacterium]
MFLESTVRRIIGTEEVEGVEIYRAGAIKPFEMGVRGVLARIGVGPIRNCFASRSGGCERLH